MLVMSVFIGTVSGRVWEQRPSECLQKWDVLEACFFPRNCKALLFFFSLVQEGGIQNQTRVELKDSPFLAQTIVFLMKGVIIGVVKT